MISLFKNLDYEFHQKQKGFFLIQIENDKTKFQSYVVLESAPKTTPPSNSTAIIEVPKDTAFNKSESIFFFKNKTNCCVECGKENENFDPNVRVQIETFFLQINFETRDLLFVETCTCKAIINGSIGQCIHECCFYCKKQ